MRPSRAVALCCVAAATLFVAGCTGNHSADDESPVVLSWSPISVAFPAIGSFARMRCSIVESMADTPGSKLSKLMVRV